MIKNSKQFFIEYHRAVFVCNDNYFAPDKHALLRLEHDVLPEIIIDIEILFTDYKGIHVLSMLKKYGDNALVNIAIYYKKHNKINFDYIPNVSKINDNVYVCYSYGTHSKEATVIYVDNKLKKEIYGCGGGTLELSKKKFDEFVKVLVDNCDISIPSKFNNILNKYLTDIQSEDIWE